MADDPRAAAARYRTRTARTDDEPETPGHRAPDRMPAAMTARQRAAAVDGAIQQAIRRGDFDNLPGAGKPLPGLGARHDPDWWIRRKIQTEKLTGLGPPALTLRVEHARMQETLDGLHREQAVREVLADFNRRVIEARRQLLGGPPVVTPTRDVDAEVAAWLRRRRARAARAAAERAAAEHAAAAERAARRGRRPFPLRIGRGGTGR